MIQRAVFLHILERPVRGRAAWLAIASSTALFSPLLAHSLTAATTRDWSPLSTVSGANWNNAANWSPSGVPQAADTVNIIDGGLSTLDHTILYDYAGPAVSLGVVTLSRSNATRNIFSTTEILSMSANSFQAAIIYAGNSPIKGRGQINQSGGTFTVNDTMYLGTDSNDFGGFSLTGGGSLTVSTLKVGYGGAGSFSQSDSSQVTTTTTILGDLPGSNGTVNLSAHFAFGSTGGGFTADTLIVGNFGTGTFNQSSGEWTLVNHLSVAATSGSSGTLNLTGGNFSVFNDAAIGANGAATVNQSAATQFGSNTFVLGNDSNPAAPPSVYNLGFGSLQTGTLTIANSGTFNALPGSIFTSDNIDVHGTFNASTQLTLHTSNLTAGGLGHSALFVQSAGNFFITNLFVASALSKSGSFLLNGTSAFLEVQSESIGGGGTGTFIQSSGTHQIDSEFDLGSFLPLPGVYELDGGALSAFCDEYIAYYASFGKMGPTVGTFNQSGGTHTVAAPYTLRLGDGLGFATYNLAGGTLSSSYIVVGGGFPANGTHGSDSLIVSGSGSLSVALSLHVDPTGFVSLGGSQTLFEIPNLTFYGGSLSLTGTSKALRTTSLSFLGTTGQLDLNANALIVQSTSASKSTALSTLAGQINNPPPNHGVLIGIISSAALADINHYAVGLFDNALLGKSSLNGATLDANSLLVSAAHLGDANDSGIVDIQDQSIVTNHWQSAQNNWAAGDLNLDGFVDLQDLTLVTNDWQQSSTLSQIASPAAATPAGVPEPATVLLLGAALALLNSRPRRRLLR